MKNIIIIMFILNILSCVTQQERKDTTLEEVIVAEINSNFENKEYFKVFQLMTYYKSRDMDKQYFIDSDKKLKQILPELLDDYHSEQNWDNFFLTYKNLISLNFELNNYNINNILYDYLVKYTPNKLYKSGVLLAEEKLNYSLLKDHQLITLKDLYIEISPEDDFLKLKDEFTNRNLEWKSSLQKDNYLDGVITIFVNKGVTFNDGVGSRDIVVGSGFFIDKKGYAITNYHVIESLVDPEYEGSNHLYVKLNGLVEKIPAKVIGWDPILDLALIKVSSIPKYSYSFSNIKEQNVGEKVLAVGSPGGLGSTVTSGIVSATDRTLLEIGSVIQIDSPINPGNSGGPLIDSDNRVTNIVFAGIEDFEGVNFAIPVKYLKENLKELYIGGKVKHVWLGAGAIKRKKKLEIVYIKPESPAFFLGLEKGDILENINGIKFSTIIEVQDYLMKFSPYEIIDLKYSRDGELFEKQICLEERPDVIMNSIIDGDASDHLYTPLFGMDIKYTGKILWNKEYLIQDVIPGSIADELDLSIGDIIQINDWEYNEEYQVVIIKIVLQTKSEGFWKKSIQISAPISVNFFI
ncbi:MAG: S1C family serine protease [Spirochaetaceae bacterium]